MIRWCRSHPRAAAVLAVAGAGGVVLLAGMTTATARRAGGQAGRQLGYSHPGVVLLALGGAVAGGLYALNRWQAGRDEPGGRE